MKLEELLKKLFDKYGDNLGNKIHYMIYLENEELPFIRVAYNDHYENYINIRESELLSSKVIRYEFEKYRGNLKVSENYVNIKESELLSSKVIRYGLDVYKENKKIYKIYIRKRKLIKNKIRKYKLPFE